MRDTTVKNLPIEDRLVYWIDLDPVTGCWLWRGHKDGDGYGRLTYQNRKYLAHRFVYAYCCGPIDPEVQLDHGEHCGVKHCVNPDHLDEVSLAENTRRWKAKLTHCSWGHPLVGHDSRGRRTCGVRHTRKPVGAPL